MTTALIKFILGIALIVVAVVGGPLAGIWSLNTLFPIVAIPYTWETWLAFLLLFGSATGLRFGSRK
jgi:ABC-type Fe2+-enterobactin transport system substrate-binding protein